MESLANYEYDLPGELVAEKPLESRAASRLLVVNRLARSFDDSSFRRLPEILRPGDLLVLNNTRVFPARLFGRLDSGSAVEIFLIRRLAGRRWEALARPGRRLKPGKTVHFDPSLSAIVDEKTENGNVVVSFEYDGDLYEHLGRVGRTPLPPYIKRDPDSRDTDRERYQTVYASKRGAIAAPTAGLHFTPELLDELRSRSLELAEITLHVGYGTFEPIRTDDLAKHVVLPESYEIGEDVAAEINLAMSQGRRVIAVGTTTTRTLEFAGNDGRVRAGKGLADLTILPGYRFRIVNGLVTNFHLPRSSLLVLVSTFAGHDLIMRAYRHAVRERYRFYSYGDCMLIE
jgi:S-adenosylmethionine:tRNA ribosyltransferase-isomerase